MILNKFSEKGRGKRRRVVVSAAFSSDESDVEKGLQGAPPPPPPFGHERSENITYFVFKERRLGITTNNEDTLTFICASTCNVWPLCTMTMNT